MRRPTAILQYYKYNTHIVLFRARASLLVNWTYINIYTHRVNARAYGTFTEAFQTRSNAGTDKNHPSVVVAVAVVVIVVDQLITIASQTTNVQRITFMGKCEQRSRTPSMRWVMMVHFILNRIIQMCDATVTCAIAVLEALLALSSSHSPQYTQTHSVRIHCIRAPMRSRELIRRYLIINRTTNESGHAYKSRVPRPHHRSLIHQNTYCAHAKTDTRAQAKRARTSRNKPVFMSSCLRTSRGRERERARLNAPEPA